MIYTVGDEEGQHNYKQNGQVVCIHNRSRGQRRPLITASIEGLAHIQQDSVHTLIAVGSIGQLRRNSNCLLRMKVFNNTEILASRIASNTLEVTGNSEWGR